MEDHCVACGEVIPEGIQVCPICNRKYEGIPALSRLDNKTLICPECGTKQANFSTICKIAEAFDMRPSELVRKMEEAEEKRDK